MSDRVTKSLFHHKYWVRIFKKYLNSRDMFVLLTEVINWSINISAKTNRKPASAQKPSLCTLSQSAHRNLDINSVTCNIKCIAICKNWYSLQGQQKLRKLTILTIKVILSKCRAVMSSALQQSGDVKHPRHAQWDWRHPQQVCWWHQVPWAHWREGMPTWGTEKAFRGEFVRTSWSSRLSARSCMRVRAFPLIL